MKRLLFYSILLVCYSAYSQQTDTIMYSDIECNEPIGGSEKQSISIKLENDTIVLVGKIIANCCGTHLIKYEVFEDSIYFTRIDTGNLCDCYCLHDINIKIGDCTSNFYNVKLIELSGNDGIDTLINAQQTGINIPSIEKKTKISPNPFSESTIISFSNPDFNSYTFKMFNSSGSMIKMIKNISTDSFQLQKENLNSGFYYFYLYSSGKTYYSGKLLIQ